MDEVNQALHKIARGTGIVFVGTVLSMLLTFLSRAIIARYFERSQYGVFTLTLTIISIIFTIALMGFQSGVPRELSRYKKEHPEVIPELISTALLLTSAASLVLTVLTVAFAEQIAAVFHEEMLSQTLRVTALVLPFMTLSMVLVAVSRGFSRVRENLYYRNILSPLLFLVMLGAGLVLNLNFIFIFIAYIISQLVTFWALLVEMLRLKLIPRKLIFNKELGKELFLFSLPLMLTGILDYVMGWTDTLMLGYYFDSDIVGLYNAAAPTARLLPIFLNSAGFLYIPTATTFFAKNQLEEMGRLYQTTTRWIFILTFPVFLLIFLFPKPTIRLLFGSKYAEASLALQILAVGFMFHVLLGLNGMSLTVIGKPKINMTGNLFASIANIFLNVLLIPKYGIVGAAIATATSYVVANIFKSTWLYKRAGIHPFCESYVRQLLLALGFVTAMLLLRISTNNILLAIAITLTVYIVYLGTTILLRTVEEEDVELISAVETRLNINLKWITNILKRFLRT